MVCLQACADEEACEGDDRETETAGKGVGGEGVGVVVFGEDVEEASVDCAGEGVELCDVSVLEPVDCHFGAEDDEEGVQDCEVRGKERKGRG